MSYIYVDFTNEHLISDYYNYIPEVNPGCIVSIFGLEYNSSRSFICEYGDSSTDFIFSTKCIYKVELSCEYVRIYMCIYLDSVWCIDCMANIY